MRMAIDPMKFWMTQEHGIPLYMNNKLTIDPARLEEFRNALEEILPLARAEAGSIYLNVGTLMQEPNVFVLSEGWRDLVEYRDEILTKGYYQKYLTLSESTYAKPRVVELLQPFEILPD